MKKLITIAALALLLISCQKEEITSIFVPATVSVKSGETYKIMLSYSPPYLDRPTVQWTSSDSQVAEIINKTNSYCEVRAKYVGTSTITCTEQSTGKKLSESCIVNVYFEGGFNTDKITIEKGESVDLGNYITGVRSDISWETSDPSICTISWWTLSAHEVGTCTITGHINQSNADITCKVEVTNIQPTQIICDNTEMNLFLDSDESNNIYKVEYRLLPNESAAEVSMSSSNQEVAEVIEGTSFIIKQSGYATLTLETSNGLNQDIYVTVADDITQVVEAKLSTPGSVIINGQMSGYGNIALNISNHSKSKITITEYGLYANNGYTTLSQHSYGGSGQTPPQVGIGQPQGETYTIVQVSCSNINMNACYGVVKYIYNNIQYTAYCYYNPLNGLL